MAAGCRSAWEAVRRVPENLDTGAADEQLVQRKFCSEGGGGEGSQSLHAAEITAVREEHFKV